MTQHTVTIRFHYAHDGLHALHQLECELEAAVTHAGVGEFDGHDVPTGRADGYLYLYGPDADAIFGVVRPILEEVPFMSGAIARLRYGPPSEGIVERTIKLRERSAVSQV